MYHESYFWEDFIWWLHCPWGFLFMIVLDFSPLLIPDAILLLTTPPSHRPLVLGAVRTRQEEPKGEPAAGSSLAAAAAAVMGAASSRKRSREPPADVRLLSFWARARKQPRKLLVAAAAAAAWGAAARYRSLSVACDAADAVGCLRPRRRALWGPRQQVARPEASDASASSLQAPLPLGRSLARSHFRRSTSRSRLDGAVSSRRGSLCSDSSSTATFGSASVESVADTATSGDCGGKFVFGAAPTNAKLRAGSFAAGARPPARTRRTPGSS